jgi:hypothetical protein
VARPRCTRRVPPVSQIVLLPYLSRFHFQFSRRAACSICYVLYNEGECCS